MKSSIIRSALAALLAVLLLVPPALAVSAETNVFYPQLSDLGRKIYDAMIAEEAYNCLHTGDSFTVTFNGPFRDVNATANAIGAAQTEAFAALELDRPELFWLSGSGTATRGNGSRLVMEVTPKFDVNWRSGGGRSVADDAAALSRAVERLAAEASAQGGAYEQLLYVHDWLTTHNEYNKSAIGMSGYDFLPWTPLSALTDVSQPVCEGYASAFKLVCDALGIPCLYVVGTAFGSGTWDHHAWNQVLLDGRWYAVDTTYDDPWVDGVRGNVSGYEMHDYFLVGSETFVKGDLIFSDNHEPDGEKVSGVTFTYPALDEEAYGGALGVPAAPAAPETPAAPSVVRQEIPASGIAEPSIQPVMIGGERFELPAYALRDDKGYLTNYVRLRDLAALMDGTEGQFDVFWSAGSGIALMPRTPYESPNGTEGRLPFTGEQPYRAYPADTFVNDASVPLTAFQIVYDGAAHTYYKLRDLGRALNFNVGWSPARGIYIEPGAPYTDAD